MSLLSKETGLIVLLKLPVRGKVKTRMAATIGDDAALIIYQQLVSITLENVRRTGLPVFLFYDGGFPSPSERDPAFFYYNQSAGDLGQKMASALSLVLKLYQKAIIIGSDCPDLQQDFITEACTILEDHELVLGPTYDGGYYLLGCKKVYPFLFDNLPWSTPKVFEKTMEAIHGNKLSAGILPILHDVDTEADWNRFESRK